MPVLCAPYPPTFLLSAATDLDKAFGQRSQWEKTDLVIMTPTGPDGELRPSHLRLGAMGRDGVVSCPRTVCGACGATLAAERLMLAAAH